MELTKKLRGKIMSRKYGTSIKNTEGDIVEIVGCEISFTHLEEHKGDLDDYWHATVNGTLNDGVTRNEAILNAYNRHHEQVKA
jgi:hypothetical protein